MNGPARLMDRLYDLLLRAYPREYAGTFGGEMRDTFLEGVQEAGTRKALVRFLLRELRDMPGSLARAHWEAWRERLERGLHALRAAASTSDLPPAPPDGRDSWRQAALETTPFLAVALTLILVTYVPSLALHAGWQHDSAFLGRIVLSLTAPVLLFALWRGLPRWAYPFGGLFLGYQLFLSYQSGLWLFLLFMLAGLAVPLALELTGGHEPAPLPPAVRRIGQSLSVDWTRLSFGWYGILPLVAVLAFDDSHANDRTAFLALSVLAITACALLYCRSRDGTAQVSALLAGLTCVICGAWLDRLSFAGGLLNWITVPPAGVSELLWLLKLWLQWGLVILSPALLPLFERAIRRKRAA